MEQSSSNGKRAGGDEKYPVSADHTRSIGGLIAMVQAMPDKVVPDPVIGE
jgi:hypothetical protein